MDILAHGCSCVYVASYWIACLTSWRLDAQSVIVNVATTWFGTNLLTIGKRWLDVRYMLLQRCLIIDRVCLARSAQNHLQWMEEPVSEVKKKKPLLHQS